MSYEVDYVRSVKCPCGNGLIEMTGESNDWNQTREKIDIKCDICSKKYKLTSKHYNPKPKHNFTIYYLENKDTNEKIQLEL